MTDQTPAPQLSTVADQVGSGVRSTIIFTLGGLASLLFHDGALTAAALAAAPAVLTALWGIYRWRKTGHHVRDIFVKLLN